MASYEISQNQNLTVNLLDDFTEQGWEVSQNVAYHSGCNPGHISSNPNMDLSSQPSWTFVYTILSIESGIVRIVVDGVDGINRTVAGTYEETFTSSNPNAEIQFYATGVSSISLLKVFSPEMVNEGRTLAFNEDANRWISDYSFVPEFMNKFINGFFSFDNGQLWEHNINETRNNFYGVQYPSIIEFIVNINPTTVKNFYSMRIVGNKSWGVDIEIRPREGKSIGQRSRIKINNFKSLQGQFFSDFLKDMSDPRFATELEALFKGADLQGEVAKIRMEITESNEVRLLSVDTIVSTQEYSY